MTSYIRSKFDDARAGSLVFPIKCPECPIEVWTLDDDEVSRVLEGDDIVQWVRSDFLFCSVI